MPAASVSLTNRIAQLERARQRGKEDGLKRGERISMSPMANLIDVTPKTLRKWCDTIPEMSGAFRRGGEGLEYEFDWGKTITALLKHFRGEQKKQEQQAARLAKISGGSFMGDVPKEFGLDEITKAIRARSLMCDQQEREGRLTDAGLTRSAVREMVSRMQQAGLRASQEQDPTGQWPADIRESFDSAVDNIMLAMEAAARDCLSALRGGQA